MRRQKLRDKIASKHKPEEVQTKWENNKMILDVKQLNSPFPKVSVVTITKDRQHLFPLPIYNWEHFDYPRDCIEWVIVDDSKTDSLRKILPIDKRIKYIYLTNPLNISDKRNYAVSKCSGEIIVNMDDDDIHFNDSILAKVRVLQTYPDKKCVFSLPLGLYDLKDGTSMISDSLGEIYPEGSLAFYKEFWEKGKFGNEGLFGEWYHFCTGRRDQLINLPFWFNFIACSHDKNVSKYRKPKKHDGPSFDCLLNNDIKMIIEKIRN